MSTQRKSAAAGTEPGGSRARGSRQRQRLIDACIAALHLYGPSRTTVEKVVAIADLSPGIVRFYFDSKDAMLVASLGYLAAEFDERVLQPVARLRDSPVRALELLVDLYLDPQLASTRKISVWYSFWGEASSRQEYLDICGKNDEDFATLVRQLMERMITETGARHLDADGIALGLIGVLEVLWQGFAFQSEESIDRAAARERSLAYLRSVFPGRFGSGTPAVAREMLPPWAYASGPLLALERERLLRPAWQVVGYTLPAQRKRRATGGGQYVVHDLTHVLEGAAPGDLTSLEMTQEGPFVLARARRPGGEAPAGWPTEWPELQPGRVEEVTVAANWKVVVEQWLESDSPRRYFLTPNQLLDLGAGGAQILRVVPEAPDRSRLIRFELRPARGAGRQGASGRRGASPPLSRQIALAETSPKALEASSSQADGPIPAALAEFRRAIAKLLPLLAQTSDAPP
ncbi:MAG TPA: TetR/AcrR family transcriptional regulator [Steroidobacteraceae bacterium]|nr:TetR/AcrR family transcriptional regulator [Steroidobacteraceae bacterium]